MIDFLFHLTHQQCWFLETKLLANYLAYNRVAQALKPLDELLAFFIIMPKMHRYRYSSKRATSIIATIFSPIETFCIIFIL